MLLKELEETSNTRKVAEILIRDCSQYLRDVDYAVDTYRLYRGMGNRNTETSESVIPDVLYFNEIDVNRKRKPTDVKIKYHNMLNDYFTKNYGYPFRNGVFVTGNINAAKKYGYLVVIFPIDGYKFAWSPDVDDMIYFRKDNYSKILNDEVEYKTSDMKGAIKSKNEIMLITEGFYYIPYSIYDEAYFSYDLENKIKEMV